MTQGSPAGHALNVEAVGDDAGVARFRLSVIRKRAGFVAANHGVRVARPGFVLLVRSGIHTEPQTDAQLPQTVRFGVTVTRKIGNAVCRNRMKRRLRALLREILPTRGIAGADHVLIGREGGVERDFAALRQELEAALARAAAGKGDPPRRPRAHSGKSRGEKSHPSGPAKAP